MAVSTFAKTNISLLDSCSKRDTYLLTRNGLHVELTIDNYDPDKKMEIKAEFFPYTLTGEHINIAPLAIIYKYNEANGYRGIFGRRLRLPRDNFKARIRLPKRKDLIKAERRLKTSNLWMVRIKWYQKGTSYGGVTQKSFLRLKKYNSFYEIESSAICHWETKATVSSKVYVNDKNSFMNIMRSYNGVGSYSHNRGISLGYSNIMGETPLGSENNFGWLYQNWTSTFEKSGTESMDRKWVLKRHESGVFGTRRSYTRKKVRKWDWVRRGERCYEYKPISEGYLDIGLLTEDFYILPQNLYTTEEMNAFIENYRPSLNTCETSINNQQIIADDIIINSDNSIYYYHAKRELQ